MTEQTTTIIDSMEAAHKFCEMKGIAKGVLTNSQAVAICRASSDVSVKIAKPSKVSTKEYKGNVLIEVTGEHRPFSFGRGKAKIIIDNFEQIKALAEKIYKDEK